MISTNGDIQAAWYPNVVAEYYTKSVHHAQYKTDILYIYYYQDGCRLA